MKGYTSTKYCIYIMNGDKYYRFANQIIVGDKVNVYEIVCTMYPILRTILKSLIVIKKSWETWHPFNDGETIPKNEYDERKAYYATQVYLSENNLIAK